MGYAYLGVFQALEERGLRPALMSGSSIGAVVSAFRCRQESFDSKVVADVVKDLTWTQLFRPISTEARYGLPAPLRLYIREGIGRHFLRPDGQPMRVNDLAIPLLVTIAGIRQGETPHAPEWYEHRLDLDGGPLPTKLGLNTARRLITGLWRTLADFIEHPERLRSLVVGAEPGTGEFDLLDAIGFSSAVPAVIHYDILREDPRMERLLDELFDRLSISRLIDGGLSDNVPARAAWQAVQSGRIQSRNALIVALDAFAPKLTSPLWIPIQRLAQANVRRNLRYAHMVQTFTRTLSPLERDEPAAFIHPDRCSWGRPGAYGTAS